MSTQQTPEEAQDVKDSKLRVELMEKAMKESNFAQAAELAITVEEQERIEQLSAKR